MYHMLKFKCMWYHPTGPARLVLFLVVLLGIFLVQALSMNQFAGISNWVVPDGFIYHRTNTLLLSDDLKFSDLHAIWFTHAVYYLASLLFGFYGYFLLNAVALTGTARVVGISILLLFPIYVLSIALPSKDILVLLFTVFFVKACLEHRFLWAIILSALVFLVRDGAAFIFVACLSTIFFLRVVKFRPYIVVLVALIFGFFLFGILGKYFSDTFIFARNFAAYETKSSALLGYGSPVDYIVRLIANGTNLAFRPSLIDENGGIPLVGIAYWISGLSSLLALAYSLYSVVRHRDYGSTLLPVFFLVSLMVISLNPIVQPRYQLPFSVLIMWQFLGKHSLPVIYFTYVLAGLISIGAMLAYQALGVGLPKATSLGPILDLF